jgi:hypothetical protein
MSPLELVRRATQRWPELLRPAISALDTLEEEGLTQIVARIPQEWMSDIARRFATELMRDNLAQLRQIKP